MPRLFYAPGACSLAVHVVLEWIGEPYERVRVDQHDPAYRSINPAGAVPALEINEGRILTQADAILHYLGRIHPAADLLDAETPEAAAELDRWGCFLTGDLHTAFFPVFTPGRYTTSESPEARQAVMEAGLALVASKLALLDAHLSGREWIVGSKRTIIDAYLLPMARWAAAKLDNGLKAYPAVDGHLTRMLADPAVQRVLAAEGARHG